MTEAADRLKGDAAYDFSKVKITGIGIQTINGDATQNQFITGDIAIHVTDDGIGGHALAYKAVIFGFSQFGTPALVPVLNDVETIIGQGSVGIDGWYLVTAVVDNGAVALPGTLLTEVRIRAGTGVITDSIIANITQETTSAGAIDEWATNVFSYALPLNVATVCSVTVTQHNGAAATVNVGCRCSFVYLGAI